jgi:predicted alternative tryptophan synthase beta-subunit
MAPCHTRFRRVDSFEFTLNNIEYVLKYWGVRVFETPEEAEAAGRKLVSEHIKEMQEMGYAIKDDGTYEEAVLEEYTKRHTR